MRLLKYMNGLGYEQMSDRSVSPIRGGAVHRVEQSNARLRGDAS